jgi:hypothetical protein
MSSNAGNTNAFAMGMQSMTNRTTGAKGANMLKSSGDLRVDAFLSLKKGMTFEEVSTTVGNLVSQLKYLRSDAERAEFVADIFRLWVHKRHPRKGEKEKLLGRQLFLALYDHFPKTCIMLVEARIFGDMAYWKDILLIWGMIMEFEMGESSKYNKYNSLIVAFRDSFMTQRSEDLKALDVFLTPSRINSIEKTTMVSKLRVKGATAPKLSMVGKYCVREKSKENKRLHWWLKDESGAMVIQSHVAFMLRKSLKRKVGPSAYEPWPISESVPFGAKQSWRKLNAKLDEALDVPEVKASLDRLDEIDPTKLPGEFTKRNIKFLLNEKVKKGPTGYEEETGNRRPDDPSRVDLRRRTRAMFTDPSRMNVGTLLPHEIAYKAYTGKSVAVIDYNNAAWEKKVQDVRADFDKVRKEMAGTSASKDDVDAISRAMATGNIVGVADVSGSMETTDGGPAPNRPIDIATGLVAFISCIAREPYRDLAFSFTDIPSAFHFKVGDHPMSVKQRICELNHHVGYNTNYQKLHEAVIRLCVDNKVPEEELPVLYIASDMNFDVMDQSLNGGGYSYNYSYGNRQDKNTLASSQKWETTHASITKMWLRAGYNKVPLMVYHNINVSHSGVQEKQDFKGVIQLTGRSEQVIKLVLYGEGAEVVEQEVEVDGVKTTMKVNNVTPYDTFRKAMEGEHFELLESVLRKSTEGFVMCFK